MTKYFLKLRYKFYKLCEQSWKSKFKLFLTQKTCQKKRRFFYSKNPAINRNNYLDVIANINVKKRKRERS